MKNKILTLIYFIIQISCVTRINQTTNSKMDSIISITIDSVNYRRSPRITDVIFNSPENKTEKRKLLVKEGENASISPSRTKIAVISPPIIGDSLCEVKIYNNYGDLLKIIRVLPLSNVAISDQGNIVMFGRPGYMDEIIFKPLIIFYNFTMGKINKDPIPFFGNCKGQYSSKENFVLISDSFRSLDYDKPVEIFIFNNKAQLISRKAIDDWSIFYEVAFSQIIIDENFKKIKIFYKKGNKDNLINYTKTFDLLGNLIELKEGWD